VKHGVGCPLILFVFQAPMRGEFRAIMVFSTRVTWVLSRYNNYMHLWIKIKYSI